MNRPFLLAVIILLCNNAIAQQLQLNITMKNETKSKTLLGTAVLYSLPDRTVLSTKKISEKDKKY